MSFLQPPNGTLPPWMNSFHGNYSENNFIVLKGDSNYNISITPAYELPTWLYYQPQSVVYPTNTEDLVQFVQIMTGENRSISPIGGSHSSFGYAFTGSAAAVNLRNMAKVAPIDEENLELTIQAGALLDDVVNFLNGTGYMTATGSCPTVGVPGWHLGGGYSMFSKLLGFGADNVKSMRVLLPNATEVEASPSSNQDLFWAMRGAGHQSFGWLTSLTIGLLPLETFVYINLETKCAQADIKSCAETIYAWQRFYYENSTVVESDLSMYYWFFQPLSDSQEWKLTFTFGYLNDGIDAQMQMKHILSPFVAYLESTGSYYDTGYTVAPFDQYSKLYDSTVPGTVTDPLYEAKLGLYLKKDMQLTDWEVMIDVWMNKFTTYQLANPGIVKINTLLAFEAYTGAMTDKPSDYNGHFQRNNTLGDLMMDLFIYADPRPGVSQSVEDAWDSAIAFLESLYRDSSDGEPALFDEILYKHNDIFQAYVNYRFAPYGEGNTTERWPALQTYYGGNLCRLCEVKKMYDPQMLFDFPQGIPAAAPKGECTAEYVLYSDSSSCRSNSIFFTSMSIVFVLLKATWWWS
ncbi:hypothetical protein ACHAWC_007360 [Mediolabrus comicus]